MTDNPYAPPAADLDVPGPTGTPLEPPPQISIGAALRFAFSKRVGFGNLAWGLLLLIIPIIGPILLLGWQAESHRRLARREAPPVRSFSFSEFSPYLMAGLVPFAVQMTAVTAMMLGMMMVGMVVGVMVAAGNTISQAVGVVLLALMGVFILALIVFMMVMLVVLQIRAELTANFPKTFELPKAFGFARRQWKAVLGHTLLLSLASIPLVLLGVLAFFIGVYFVAVGLQFAQMHLRWQIYERDVRTGGEALPIFAGNGADI